MDDTVIDGKSFYGCGGERPTNTESSVIEEIERLDIDEYTKESILRKLKRDASREGEMTNEIFRCYNEIQRLEKAIIYLSKVVADCKEGEVMDEYSFKDVIIDPTSEKARACIGKVCYYSDNPISCIEYANSNYNDKAGILESIQLGNHHPFYGACAKYGYCCIIPKREEPKPEYVPFDTIEEFVKGKFNI